MFKQTDFHNAYQLGTNTLELWILDRCLSGIRLAWRPKPRLPSGGLPLYQTLVNKEDDVNLNLATCLAKLSIDVVWSIPTSE